MHQSLWQCRRWLWEGESPQASAVGSLLGVLLDDPRDDVGPDERRARGEHDEPDYRREERGDDRLGRGRDERDRGEEEVDGYRDQRDANPERCRGEPPPRAAGAPASRHQTSSSSMPTERFWL